MSSKINRIAVAAIIAFTGFSTGAKAQVETDSTFIFDYDPIRNAGDTVIATGSDIISFEDAEIRERPAFAKERRDRERIKKEKKDMGLWRPDPKKALWLSIVLPGAGQIYNRKYWKLPIVYGGFMGFIYAITWNNKNYSDYSEAYLHVMTDDVNTPSSWHQSWQNFVPRNRNPKDYITNSNFRSNLKSAKDYYRRYRDLSIILTVAWYFLCMADSYVDAQLFDFDISPDISLHLAPTLAPQTNRNPGLFGLTCSINF